MRIVLITDFFCFACVHDFPWFPFRNGPRSKLKKVMILVVVTEFFASVTSAFGERLTGAFPGLWPMRKLCWGHVVASGDPD